MYVFLYFYQVRVRDGFVCHGWEGREEESFGMLEMNQ